MDEKKAKEIMDKIIADYDALTERITEQLVSNEITPSVASRKIDNFCIDTLRGVLGSYYADRI